MIDTQKEKRDKEILALLALQKRIEKRREEVRKAREEAKKKSFTETPQ